MIGTHRSSVGGAAVGSALADTPKDADGAFEHAEQGFAAAHGALVVVAAVLHGVGARVDALRGGEGGGGHGEGQDGDDVLELHFGGWGRSDQKILKRCVWFGLEVGVRSWALLVGLDAGAEMGVRWEGRKGVYIHFVGLLPEVGACDPRGRRVLRGSTCPLLGGGCHWNLVHVQPHVPSPLLRRSAPCVLLRLLTPVLSHPTDGYCLGESEARPAGSWPGRCSHRHLDVSGCPQTAGLCRRLRRDSVVGLAGRVSQPRCRLLQNDNQYLIGLMRCRSSITLVAFLCKFTLPTSCSPGLDQPAG